MELISWPDHPISKIIGGQKVANLSTLHCFGVNVPPFYCVNFSCYKSYLKVTGLEEKITFLLEDVNTQDFTTLRIITHRITNLINNHAIPSVIETELHDALEKLSRTETFYAIRSSSSHEDHPNKSYAGLYRSYLNIRKENVLTYIRKCWASTWTLESVFMRITEKNHYLKTWLLLFKL